MAVKRSRRFLNKAPEPGGSSPGKFARKRRTTQARTALHEEHQFATAALESAGAMVMVTDLDGRIVRFNRACQRVSGYSYAEVQGRQAWDFLIVPEEVEEVKAIYRRLAEQLDPIEHENRWMDRNGRPHLISWYSAVISDAENTARHVVRIGVDITIRRQMEKELQHSEQALRESQAQLRRLTAGLITAQEEERKRIALELHDDVSQRLAALVIEANALQKSLSMDRGKLIRRLREMEKSLTAVAENIHLTAHQLHPAVLEHLGLEPALKSLCDDFSRQHRPRVKLAVRSPTDTISGGVALCLYRVVQEALRNAAAHSGAAEALVSLEDRNGTLHLSISDPGSGFDVEQVKGRGLGLISMEERVRHVGGTFTVKTEPGRGTRIDVEIPLSKKADEPP